MASFDIAVFPFLGSLLFQGPIGLCLDHSVSITMLHKVALRRPVLTYFYFMRMDCLLTCVSVYHVHGMPTEVIRSSGAGIADGCEPPCGMCYTGALEEHP